jgi:hypothetical protein
MWAVLNLVMNIRLQKKERNFLNIQATTSFCSTEFIDVCKPNEEISSYYINLIDFIILKVEDGPCKSQFPR